MLDSNEYFLARGVKHVGPKKSNGYMPFACPLCPDGDRDDSAGYNEKLNLFSCFKAPASTHGKCSREKFEALITGFPLKAARHTLHSKLYKHLPSVDEYHARLMSDDTVLDKLWSTRKISREVVTKYKLGLVTSHGVDKLVIPFGVDGKYFHCLHYDAFRLGDPSYKMVHADEGSLPWLYPYENWDSPVLYVVEGHADCLSIISAGYPAVTMGSVSSSLSLFVDVLHDKKVFLLFDNDGPGQEAMNKQQAILRRHGIHARTMRLTDIGSQHKDPNEALVDGVTLDMETMEALSTPPAEAVVCDVGFKRVLTDDTLLGKYVRFEASVVASAKPYVAVTAYDVFCAAEGKNCEGCEYKRRSCGYENIVMKVELKPNDTDGYLAGDNDESVRKRYLGLKCQAATLRPHAQQSIKRCKLGIGLSFIGDDHDNDVNALLPCAMVEIGKRYVFIGVITRDIVKQERLFIVTKFEPALPERVEGADVFTI